MRLGEGIDPIGESNPPRLFAVLVKLVLSNEYTNYTTAHYTRGELVSQNENGGEK